MNRAFCVLTVIVMLSASCGSKKEELFPYLRQPPDKEAIPGTYALSYFSTDLLKKNGFFDFTATLTLRNDGTFRAETMPHIWFDGRINGYDTFDGKWEIDKLSRVYDVILSEFKFTAGSVYSSPPEYATIFAGIADRTPSRPDYALAVPINHGDEGYLIFVKIDQPTKQSIQSKTSENRTSGGIK